MKNQLVKFVAFCAIVCGFSLSSIAQDAGNRSKMTPDQRIEMRLSKMKTNLNLTDDQTAKVKTLLQNQETTIHGSKDKQAWEQNRATMTAEMGKILTPDQMTKYNAMMEQQKQRMRSNDNK